MTENKDRQFCFLLIWILFKGIFYWLIKPWDMIFNSENIIVLKLILKHVIYCHTVMSSIEFYDISHQHYLWELSNSSTFLLTGGEVIHYYYFNKVCYDCYWYIFNSLKIWACWKHEPWSIHLLILSTYHNMGSINIWKDKVIFPGISKIFIT